ncbi:CHAD domain-containing protein [Thiomicrorhabdus sp.]|uniref:CHAD domain-containing protein n=1 Tax=Thiomicrorhabdus sp. TaxID=2039724 RepID=UPI0029C9151A|nr:CHAD domain-containing protein [Thiomicrorhabdus sp.]
MQNQFSELRDAYFSDPKEIENLHSLRVFLRKILSIEVVQRQENTDLQSLTELIKLSNPLRDLDVFEDQCVAELFEDQEVRQKMGAAVERHRQRYLSEFESALRAFSLRKAFRPLYPKMAAGRVGVIRSWPQKGAEKGPSVLVEWRCSINFLKN